MIELLLVTVFLVSVVITCLLVVPLSVAEENYRKNQDKVMLMMMGQGM